MNKELQFLQTAINEAGLTDLYAHPSSTNGSTGSTGAGPGSASNTHHHVTLPAGDMTNIETILAMQCELLEHQRELKQIEYEQIEQLRQLHSNLNRLSKKFDSFETIVTNVNNGTLKLNRTASANLNKLNNSLQHIKVDPPQTSYKALNPNY